jgi:hypothetical protein
MPPFYLGYSLTANVLENGYHGTVTSKRYKKIWIQELIENPHLFVTRIIKTFAVKKEAWEVEKRLQKLRNVVSNPLYINQAIAGHADNTGSKVINNGEREARLCPGDDMPIGYILGRLKKYSVQIGMSQRGKKKVFTEAGMRKKKLSKSGENSSSKRPEVREKIKKTVTERWTEGVYTDRRVPDISGEKNPFYGKRHTEASKENNRMKHLKKLAPCLT